MSRFKVVEANNTIARGYYYEGQAFLATHKGIQFIVVATDIANLESVFDAMFGIKIDKSKVQLVCCTSPQNLEKTVVPATIAEIMAARKLYWFYLPGAMNCQIASVGCKFQGNEAINLGEAVESTITECKLLLRKYGFTRGEIEQLAILPDDDIPF